MKQKTFLLMITFFALILTGCQQKASKRTSKTTTNPSSLNCSGQAYWTTPGCVGFCQNSPSNYACNGGATTGGTTGGTTNGGASGGTTTGGTTGGITTGMCALNPTAAYCSSTYCSVFPKPYGCLANGTNCFQNQTAAGCGGSSTVIAANPYWGVWYPGGVPASTCSSTRLPDGLTTALETRKGTITLTGKGKYSGDPITEYSPFDPDASQLINTTTMLKSVSQSKLFFLTDSVLKFRVKVNPEPDSPGTASSVCYGRGSGAYLSGYTKLQYTVKVYAASSTNAVTWLANLGPFTTGVNGCSEAIDLSEYKEASPSGLIVTISDVKENKNCSNWNWNSVGWNKCSNFNKVRSMECWSMDFEVAADGTKTFD